MRLRSHTGRKHIPSLYADVWQIILNHIRWFCREDFGYLRERCRLRIVCKDFFMDEFCNVPTFLVANGCSLPAGYFDGLCRVVPPVGFQNVQFLSLDRRILTFQDQVALSQGSWSSLVKMSLIGCSLHDWPCSRLIRRLCDKNLASLRRLYLDQNPKLDYFTFYEIGRLILHRFRIMFDGTIACNVNLCSILDISVRQQNKASFVEIIMGVMNDIWHANDLSSISELDELDGKNVVTNIHCDARPDGTPRILRSFTQGKDCVDLTLLQFFFNRVFHPQKELVDSAMRFYELPVPQPSVRLVNRRNNKLGRRSLRLM